VIWGTVVTYGLIQAVPLAFSLEGIMVFSDIASNKKGDPKAAFKIVRNEVLT